MPVGRRAVLSGLAAAAALPSLVRSAAARGRPAGRKILIKGGYVATLDKNLGELSSTDVLIDGADDRRDRTNLIAPRTRRSSTPRASWCCRA